MTQLIFGDKHLKHVYANKKLAARDYNSFASNWHDFDYINLLTHFNILAEFLDLHTPYLYKCDETNLVFASSSINDCIVDALAYLEGVYKCKIIDLPLRSYPRTGSLQS
jgi:hypothetical protein